MDIEKLQIPEEVYAPLIDDLIKQGNDISSSITGF